MSVPTDRSISRRALLRGGAAGGLALGVPGLLPACSSDAGGKAKVRMWTFYTEQQELWPALIKEFEAAHPNVTIENRIFGDTDSYLVALQASVSGGDPPEIYAPHVLAIEYGKAGIALDLTAALGDSLLADFFPSTRAEYTDGGKQYAVGWMAQTFGLFYNPNILKQAGVDVPETWDDLVAAAPVIRQKTGLIPCSLSNNPGPTGLDLMLPMITQATDDPELMIDLDMQRNGASWDSPPVIQALARVKTLVDKQVCQPDINGVTDQQAAAAFFTQKAAMYYSGSWEPQGFNLNAPKEFLPIYQVAETPAWRGGAKHWCANQAGAGLAVSATGENSGAAVDFVKWLYEPTRYAKIMNDSSSMPATMTAADQVTDPFMKKMTSWLLSGNGCPHILFGKGSSESAANQLAAVIGGQASPEQAAAAIQDGVRKARGR